MISPQPDGVCTSRPYTNRHTHADNHETVGNHPDTMNKNHFSVTKKLLRMNSAKSEIQEIANVLRITDGEDV